MSSDRGTMQRGPISGTDQQAGWQVPTSPEGRRLPSAPRERRPGLAALAVLLIVGGALSAGFLITKTGKRNGAMVVRANHVTAGRDVLGLALKEGQLPAGLQVGDHIDIYQVSNANEACPGSSGSALSSNAIVLAIAVPSASSGSSAAADVQVALNPRDAGAVACNASNGIVGIAVLPAGGHRSGGTGPPQPGQGVQPSPSGGASAPASPSGTRTG